ncbi:hypothetical protein MNBD_ALPHA02-1324 [hydrothermal vent metagenome]|uniref:Prolyl 4-hydroxylase subunit alpha n=1 Tax=hydrothermal vent metagenome TaxID=652676 RepID=A0A3B0RVU7_9ZZZZ
MMSIVDKIDAIGWQELAVEMHDNGYAIVPGFLVPEQCQHLIDQYNNPDCYRKTVVMERYRFGLGEYKYFDYPLQTVFLLNDPGADFEGGEFVLTQQIPRAQSRAIVLKPGKGDMIIFTTNFRPVKGTRGYYRANMRHGVSEVHLGERHTAGIIFHDAVS